MSFGRVVQLLPSLAGEQLRRQRVVLLTSVQGSKRRSAQLLAHVLRNSLNCTLQTATVAEPSIQACQDARNILQRTQSSVIVALGGATVLDAARLLAAIRDKDEPLSIVAVPTVPCGGKETATVSELFDFEKEEKVIMEMDAKQSVIIDAELARDDKISFGTDLNCFLNTFAVALNREVNALRSDEATLSQLQQTFRLLSDTTNKPLSVQDRELLFKAGLGKDVNARFVEENSIDSALCSIILPRLALSRSLARVALLPFSLEWRCGDSKEFAQILQDITQTNSCDDAINKVANLAKRSPGLGNLRGVLAKYMDSKAVDQIAKDAENWLDEASVVPAYAKFGFNKPELATKLFA